MSDAPKPIPFPDQDKLERLRANRRRQQELLDAVQRQHDANAEARRVKRAEEVATSTTRAYWQGYREGCRGRLVAPLLFGATLGCIVTAVVLHALHLV